METNSTSNSATSAPSWVLQKATVEELAEGAVWPGRHSFGIFFDALLALWRRKAIAVIGMALGALLVVGVISLRPASFEAEQSVVFSRSLDEAARSRILAMVHDPEVSGLAALIARAGMGTTTVLRYLAARLNGRASNLAVLSSGSSPKAGGARLAQKIAGVLSGLRRRFPTGLLVMPAPSTPAWKHYAEAGLADTSMLVIRTQSANRRRVQLGMKLVREKGFQVAGCLLDMGRGEQASLRLSRLAPTQAAEPVELDL